MPTDDRVWRERCLRRSVLAGDEVAWRTWYDESFAALHAYVLWRCAGLSDLADDLVQETWLTAVRRIRSFEPERGTFAGWLRGIAANVIRHDLRRSRPERRVYSLVSTDGRACTDVDIEKRETAERIARALASLPERYESVLRAKYLDGQSVQAIATAWNETPKAVESVLVRARQALREHFDKSEVLR